MEDGTGVGRRATIRARAPGADLKGKKIGVTRFGSATDISARIALERNSLVPGKDVTLLQLGGIGEILAGLRGGSIDAGILSPPTMWGRRNSDFANSSISPPWESPTRIPPS